MKKVIRYLDIVIARLEYTIDKDEFNKLKELYETKEELKRIKYFLESRWSRLAVQSTVAEKVKHSHSSQTERK